MDFNNGEGLVAYNFEPEFSEAELNELENERKSETAQSFTHVNDFCNYENCIMMPSSDENTCCRCNDLTIGNLEDLECITEHSHFETIVLNPVVLEVAFIQIMAYKGSRGRAPDALSNTYWRFLRKKQQNKDWEATDNLRETRQVFTCTYEPLPGAVVENNMMSQFPDLEVLKEIPGYQAILKAVLKSQIQLLVEQLSCQTGEESVILTASVSDGTLCHLGSESGKVFLEDHEDFKSQFLGFCLKRNHKRKVAETAQKEVPELPIRSKRAKLADTYSTPVHPMTLHKVSPGRNVARQRRPPVHTETKLHPSHAEEQSANIANSKTFRTDTFQGVDNTSVQLSDVKPEMDNISGFGPDISVIPQSSDAIHEQTHLSAGDSNQSIQSLSVIKQEPEEDLEITGVEMSNNLEGSQSGFDQSQWLPDASDRLGYGASGSETDATMLFDAGNQSNHGNKLETSKDTNCATTTETDSVTYPYSPVQVKIEQPSDLVTNVEQVSDETWKEVFVCSKHNISEEDGVNIHTYRKTKADINRVNTFLLEEGQNREIQDIEPEVLDPLLAKFIKSAKKADGQEYEPNTLRNFISTVDRHLRTENYGFTIMNSKVEYFPLTKRTLISRQNELKELGKGNMENKSDTLTEADIDILYEKNILGQSSQESLLNTVWLNNQIYFGFKSTTEHYQLLWGDIELKTSFDDLEYLEYSKRLSSTKADKKFGGHSNTVVFANLEQPSRCPVQAYKAYAAKRPPDYSFPYSPFYLSACAKGPLELGNDTYVKMRCGEKRLSSLLKVMAENAGLNKKITNRSASRKSGGYYSVNRQYMKHAQ